MKKTICLVILTMCGVVAFAQQPTVAVAGFDVQGGITQDEAGVVYELFIAELVSTGAVRVLDRYNLDKIMTELKFQTTDWSNSRKTASLGRALNANIIIRGRLMKMGGTIYWTATMLNINTAQVLFSSRQALKDISEVWGKLPDFCKQLVAKIQTPRNMQGLSTVAVTTFDVQGGITPEEAGVVTELFITELVSMGDMNVVDRVSFDKIMAEMKFQTSDWSNSQKTAALGRVMNAENIIRGQLMKMGDTIYWTATMLDVNTAQVLYSSRLQLKNLSEVWGKLTEFRQQIVAKLPPPNLFVGRWQASKEVDGKELICILNIQPNGTVIVERYDTITETRNRVVDAGETALSGLVGVLTLGLLHAGGGLDPVYYDYKTTYSSPNRSGNGTGTYSSVARKSGDNINTTISFNLNGIASGIPAYPQAEVTLKLKEPDSFSFSSSNDTYFSCKYEVYTKSGKPDSEKASSGSRYINFTRLK
ncbi:MAG: hypothetical protein FWF55_07645 [Treponema sp.]|nr:hypothetical protein [Treponema sp.]